MERKSFKNKILSINNISKVDKTHSIFGIGEIAQWLSPLIYLAKDLVSNDS